MWIAKNSFNGYVYGREFSSIYDCQNFIDKELIILEWLYRQIIVIEGKIEDNALFKQWFHDKYGDDTSVCIEIFAHIEFALDKLMNSLDCKSSGEVIKELAETPYLSNNVIRCFNVEQQRFADGFDY